MKSTFFSSTFLLVLAFLPFTGLQAQQEWLLPGQKSTNFSYPNDKSLAVAVDESGSVYTTGTSENTNNQYNNWAWEIPVKKYSPYGGRVFSTHKNLVPSTWSNQDEAGFAIGASAKQDRVIVGGYKHVWYFPYLAFFSASSGTFIAEIPFNYCQGAILNVDVVEDAVYVIGRFYGSLSFGNNTPTLTSVPSKQNIFIAKFDIASRTLLRVFQVYADELTAKDIKADAYDNIYFTAITKGMVQFIGVTGVYVPTASGQREAFVCRVNPAGLVVWAKSASPTFTDPNFSRNFPVGLFSGDESTTIVVGGNDANTGSAYIRKYNAANGASLGVSSAFTGKVINDLAVGTCGLRRICAVGNEVLSNGAPGFGFMFEFPLGNFNNGYYHYTNDPAVINGVAIDKMGNPAIAGVTPSYISSFSFRGKAVAQTNSHEFAGKFKISDPCCANRSLSLDGSNDFAEMAAPPVAVNYTLETWAQSTATNTGACNGEFRTLAAWNNFGKYAIEIGECAGNLSIKYYRPSSFSSTMKMEFSSTQNIRGGWHHIAVSFDGNNLNAFVDGQQVSLNFVTSGLSIGMPSKLYIGRDFFTTMSTEHWQGRIDELRIWDYAKSPTAIQNGMNCALSGTESGLVAYFPFDQGNPSQINTGVTTSWSVPTNSPYSSFYLQLQNFSMTGANSNWTCSSVTLNGICAPATGEITDDRSIEPENVAMDEKQEFKLYPNPGSGWFNLKLNESNETPLNWRVLNLTGAVVLQGTLLEGETEIQVETGSLPNGMYLIQLLKEENRLGVKKWVKE